MLDPAPSRIGIISRDLFSPDMHGVKRLHEIEFEDEAKGIVHEASETIREVKHIHEVKSDVIRKVKCIHEVENVVAQVLHEIIHEVHIENAIVVERVLVGPLEASHPRRRDGRHRRWVR